MRCYIEWKFSRRGKSYPNWRFPVLTGQYLKIIPQLSNDASLVWLALILEKLLSQTLSNNFVSHNLYKLIGLSSFEMLSNLKFMLLLKHPILSLIIFLPLWSSCIMLQTTGDQSNSKLITSQYTKAYHKKSLE